jgi:hypothetical protein
MENRATKRGNEVIETLKEGLDLMKQDLNQSKNYVRKIKGRSRIKKMPLSITSMGIESRYLQEQKSPARLREKRRYESTESITKFVSDAEVQSLPPVMHALFPPVAHVSPKVQAQPHR